MKLDRIVVAIDGSDNSLQAAAWTAGLARSTGAEVVAVHAVGLLDRIDGGRAKVASAAHRAEIVERFEQCWSAPLDDGPVACRRVVRDGSPVDVVLAVAEEVDADLVVVGSRGFGGYPELLLGSTSTQIAQRSPRPVVIIPAEDRPTS